MTRPLDGLHEVLDHADTLAGAAEALLAEDTVEGRVGALEEVLLEQVVLLRALVEQLTERPSVADVPALAPAVVGDDRRAAYRQLSEGFRRFVEGVTPAGSSVLVVSKGDSELLLVPGRTGSHFPQTALGSYAGYHPESSAAAIDHLEVLRRRGADFLAFPGTARWWLEYYGELRAHLEARHRMIADDPELGIVWDLRIEQAEPARPQEDDQRGQLTSTLVACLPAGEPIVLVRDDGAGGVTLLRAELSDDLVVTGELHGLDPSQAWAAIDQWRRQGLRHVVVPALDVARVADELWAALAAAGRTVVDQRHICQVVELLPHNGTDTSAWSRPHDPRSERA